MAILTLKIDDEVLEKYKARAGDLTPQTALEATLVRFQEVDPKRRFLLFSDEEREKIEGLFGHPIETAGQFVAWVKDLLSVNVLGVDIPMRDGQRKRLAAEAKFWKTPFEDYVESKITRIVDQALGRN